MRENVAFSYQDSSALQGKENEHRGDASREEFSYPLPQPQPNLVERLIPGEGDQEGTKRVRISMAHF